MTVHDQISANRWRTIFLFFLFGILLVIITGLLSLALSIEDGDISSTYKYFTLIGPLIAVFGVIWGIVSWYAGAKMIVRLSDAHEIEKSKDPEMYRLLENLSISQGLPTPKLYLIPDESLNAFASGTSPKKSLIAVTTGLRKKLNKEELEGVLAHELAHIKNRDTRVMLLAIVMVGILQLLADFVLRNAIYGRRDSDGKNAGLLILIVILIYILGYFGSILVQLAISRKREYLADASGALMTRNPDGLVSALEKISQDSRLESLDGKSSLSALCIANPFDKKKSFMQTVGNLFATHPPIDKRITALRGGGF